jgi:mRNA interferase RelE/StbE
LNVRFKASFARDLRDLKDKSLLERIKELIANVEAAQSLAEVSNLKKLRGGGGYYRVRIGDYRVGLAMEERVIVFVRVLHRREVYRYFP